MPTPEPTPEVFDVTYDGPPPEPWTSEQIAAWNAENGALPNGGAVAFEVRRREVRGRLKELKNKPVLTTPELTDAVRLLMEYVERMP